MNTKTYPGDELVPNPYFVTTHSIHINADPSAIWPWIVQMGYHRGGWYIDTWWDEFAIKYFWPLVVPKDDRPEFKPPATQIIDDLQNLKVGDTVLDGPPGSAYYHVMALEPNQYMLLRSISHFKYATPGFLQNTRWELKGSFSWAFILDKVDETATRLTIRARIIFEPRFPFILIKPLFVAIDTLHVRAMLRGFKKRVKGSAN